MLKKTLGYSIADVERLLESGQISKGKAGTLEKLLKLQKEKKALEKKRNTIKKNYIGAKSRVKKLKLKLDWQNILNDIDSVTLEIRKLKMKLGLKFNTKGTLEDRLKKRKKVTKQINKALKKS